MKRTARVSLILSAILGLSAGASGQTTATPVITAYRVYVNGEALGQAEVVAVEERDAIRLEVDVLLIVEDETQPPDEIEFFYEKNSTWIPFDSYLSPEGPPVEADTDDGEFRPLVELVPLGPLEYTVVIQDPDSAPGFFRAPLLNGTNQARLLGLIDFDVQYIVQVRIWTAENVTEDDPAPGFFFVLEVTEDAALRPPTGPPFADAGADQTVEAGATATLDASDTFDAYNMGFDPLDPAVVEKDVLTYDWEWLSGPMRVDPVISDPENAPWAAEVTLDVIGTYEFRVTVSDEENPPSTDTVQIEVVPFIAENRPPFAAVTGPDEAVVSGAIVTLSGSQSNDPDGDELTYRWIQTDAVGGALPLDALTDTFQPLDGLEEAESHWQALLPGTYYFRLIVSDGELSDAATGTVTVVSSAAAGEIVGSQDEAAGTDEIPGSALAPVGCGGSLLPLTVVPLALWGLRTRRGSAG